jgi:tetratricopeptide (TPR) repeat protein
MLRAISAAALAMLLATMSPGAATPASAQDQVQAPETGTPVEPRRMSRAEFLTKVEQLIKAGRLDEAMALIARLPDKGVLAFDKRFIAARIARLRGDHETAEKVYRQMLVADPNLHRVRLELAQSLFERGNFEAAEYNFRLVLAADIPGAVRKRIGSYLAQMRRDKWWTGTFQFAIVPDTNINTGPSTREVTIFGLPFQLSEDTTQKSGVGVETGVSGDVRPRIGPNLRLAIGGRLYALEYLSGGDFDDRSATLRVGPIYAHSRGEVGFFGTGTRRWYAHDPYSTTLGGRAFGDYDLTSRIQASGGVTFLVIDLDNGTRLDGQYYGIDARLSYTFDDRSIGRVFGGWAVNDRNDPGESYDFYRFGIGYSREFPLGLIGYIAPEVRFRNYHGKPGLFEEDRDDIMYRVESRLILRQLIIRDFAPFVSVAYEVNNSSIDFFEYDRLRGSIGFTKRF